jgi:hypothetical protein
MNFYFNLFFKQKMKLIKFGFSNYKHVWRRISSFNFVNKVKKQKFERTVTTNIKEENKNIDAQTIDSMENSEFNEIRSTMEKENEEKKSFKQFIEFFLDRKTYTWDDYVSQVEAATQKGKNIFKKLRGISDDNKEGDNISKNRYNIN